MNDKLYSKIKKDCETLDSCIIEIEDVTDFKWDTMYVVFPNATPEELEKVFGAAGISFWDESMNLIFYENGSIVYNEASEFNVLSDTRLKSGWSANSSYESRFLRNKLPNYCRSMWLFTPENDCFTVKKLNVEWEYALIPVDSLYMFQI